MKLKEVLAGTVAVITAVTASIYGMSVSAGAYTNIDIWKNYEALQSGKEITLALEPRQNESTSESVIYKIPVGKSGTFKMEISADTYYVQASFVKKQVVEKSDGSTSTWEEEVNNNDIQVLMTNGSCYNQNNGDVNFIWDWDTRSIAGSCEFAVEPGEYFVGFTVYYDMKGNPPVPFDKMKDEFGNGNITINATYPFDKTYTSEPDDDYSPYDISHYGIDEIKTKIYSGKPIKPSVRLYSEIIDMENNYVRSYLIEGTDYTVSYKNNTKIGTATVTISGKGDYTGTKTLTFKIVPKKVKLTGKTSGTKETLSWKKSAGAAGYEVYRSIDGGKFTRLTATKTLKYTAKLTAGKSYKFKVRPYATVNGKKVYGSWSNVVSVN